MKLRVTIHLLIMIVIFVNKVLVSDNKKGRIKMSVYYGNRKCI